MDTLALLCNLHADGPDTLQLLRRAGLDTLAEVEATEPEELSTVLALTRDRAERLRREARHLRERLEPDEPTPEPAPEGRASRPRRPELEVPARELRRPSERRAAPAAVEHPAARERVEPPAAGPEPAETPEPVVELPPARAPRVADPRFLPGCLDGLDAEVHAALVAAGVLSLDDLAQAEPLELARATALDYTRLVRLRFLARRAGPAPAAPRASGPSPEDVAGPFA